MSKISVREHLLNLINAIANLSPSRSIISQLIMLLPEDHLVVERSYPEAGSADAKRILEVMGIRFGGERVERVQGSFATAIYSLIHDVFNWLDNGEVRSGLAKLAGIDVETLPNPYYEWSRLVIEKLVGRYGDKVLVLLKELLSRESFKEVAEYRPQGISRRSILSKLINDIGTRVQADAAELGEVLRSIIGDAEVIEEGRDYSKLLWHGKYHLDILSGSERRSSPMDRGERDISVNHKETLRKVLEETTHG